MPEPTESPRYLRDEHQTTQGSVTIGGRAVTYQAEAGILVVHVKDPLDDDAPLPKEDRTGPPPPQPPEASMSYAAYFKGDREDARRPITFLYNGGPGSSTVWLHMGAFGPKRVVTVDGKHGPAAPYRVVDNEFSLIDASDLVFVDAPGTGFGHLRGADKEKAFFGVDQDAHAFANFIVEFLSRHGRWNSPEISVWRKLRDHPLRRSCQCFAEREGRGSERRDPAVADPELRQQSRPAAVQSGHGPALCPGAAHLHRHGLVSPQAGQSACGARTVAARSRELRPDRVFAGAGGGFDAHNPSARRRWPPSSAPTTGLASDYIERANLRVNGGEFEKTLLGSDTTAGRLDTRFAGPTLDPMSKEAEYDPQSAAISSAYVSAFNDYVRGTLKFGDKKTYKPITDLGRNWDLSHQPPGSEQKIPMLANVMIDLAVAMKQNPSLKVQLNAATTILATPYFAAEYELHQLPIQTSLQSNIEMHFYTSGHMVYAREPDLKALHANVADFIERTKNTAEH